MVDQLLTSCTTIGLLAELQPPRSDRFHTAAAMDNYIGAATLLFNCNIRFDDSPIQEYRPVPALDVEDLMWDGENYRSGGVHILGRDTYRVLRDSLVLPGRIIPRAEDLNERIRDFGAPFAFAYGIGRKNQSDSELWLSAYIGNYIGNCLSFLNDFLHREEIEPASQGLNTKLLVKWRRVATTLGALAGFQVVFVLAALLYCQRGFEIVDGVLTFSSMFADFPFGSEAERWQESVVHQGKFVPEGDGYRWVFVTGAGKTSKME